jgi:hypothetical protein
MEMVAGWPAIRQRRFLFSINAHRRVPCRLLSNMLRHSRVKETENWRSTCWDTGRSDQWLTSSCYYKGHHPCGHPVVLNRHNNTTHSSINRVYLSVIWTYLSQDHFTSIKRIRINTNFILLIVAIDSSYYSVSITVILEEMFLKNKASRTGQHETTNIGLSKREFILF